MKLRRPSFLLASFLLLTACKSKPAESGPTEPAPGVAAAPLPTGSVVQPPDPAATGSGDSAPGSAPDEKPAGTGENKPPAVEPAGDPSVDPGAGEAGELADPKDSLPPIALPKPPEDSVLLVARRAATNCRPDGSPCAERAELAAKIPLELEVATNILEKGTDQDKGAIREALLLVRDPAADKLLSSQVISANGTIDAPVVAHLEALRSPAGIDALLERLKKTGADEAIAIISALGRIGGDEGRGALTALLADKAAAPYWGEVCRGISQSGATSLLKEIVAIGNALSATPRQAQGCRNAEAAFRMLDSAGGLIVNVGGIQVPYGAALAWQRREDPSELVIVIPAATGATCAAPGEERARFTVRLDRAGKPIVGDAIPARLNAFGADHGDEGVYFFRFDALTLKRDTSFQAHVSAVLQKSKVDEHLIISGPIDGTYCGPQG